MKLKKYIYYKNVTFCCKICSNKICSATAFYGQGKCKSCATSGKNNAMFGSHNCGKNSPHFGKKCSKKSKLKMSKITKINWKQGKITGMLGKKHSKKTCLKISKSRKGKYSGNKNHMFKKRGKNSPFWQGGISFLPYTKDFNRELKLKIRTRDNFTCQCCKITEQEHFRNNKRINLIIHHIDYNKENCKPTNLITICNLCNIKANSNRDYWFAYYTYIITHFKERVSAF
jgi:hypothetical protein